MTALDALLAQARACRVCEAHLPLGPRPVLQAGENARLMIISQAPGRKVHDTGIPWNDASGDRLRQWLQLDKATFYDPQKVAIIPMGFCYPGKGKGGDLPPRPECAPLWHPRLFAALPNIRLRLLIGNYALRYYLSTDIIKKSASTADKVACWQDCLPEFFPLPHPSPRNIRWFKTHPWFEDDVIPALRAEVQRLFADD